MGAAHASLRGRNAGELTTKFLETIQSVGLSVNDMRAQGCDGATVMSGHVSGVQTRIRLVNPNAVYVHCRHHLLNLCIVHASKLPLVRNIIDTMQEVTLAFKFSAQRGRQMGLNYYSCCASAYF